MQYTQKMRWFYPYLYPHGCTVYGSIYNTGKGSESNNCTGYGTRDTTNSKTNNQAPKDCQCCTCDCGVCIAITVHHLVQIRYEDLFRERECEATLNRA
mmetsp:Transcript_51683/g.85888  ORF Transcript_51683/g.85888 Transcript_51683/m.85888 type:complete len:98 (-) Transcript_51683:239-532(-)